MEKEIHIYLAITIQGIDNEDVATLLQGSLVHTLMNELLENSYVIQYYSYIHCKHINNIVIKNVSVMIGQRSFFHYDEERHLHGNVSLKVKRKWVQELTQY